MSPLLLAILWPSLVASEPVPSPCAGAPRVAVLSQDRPSQDRPSQNRPSAADLRTKVAAATACLEETTLALTDGERGFAGELVAAAFAALAGLERSNDAELLVVYGQIEARAEELDLFETLRDARIRILAVRERTLPEDHPSRLRARDKLSLVYGDLGEHVEARRMREALLADYERLYPPDHVDVLRTRGNLGVSLGFLGDYEGALELLESMLLGYLRVYPDGRHEEVLRARWGLVETLEHVDRPEARLDQLEQQLALYATYEEFTLEELAGEHDRLERLAVALLRRHDLQRGRWLTERVLSIRSRSLPGGHPLMQRALSNHAGVLYELGEHQEAYELYRRLLEVLQRSLPGDHLDVQHARRRVGTSLAALERPREAHALYEAALEVYARTLPVEHSDRLRLVLSLARTKRELSDLDGARTLLEDAVTASSQKLPRGDPDLLRVRLELARNLYIRGELARAGEIVTDVLGADLPSTSDEDVAREARLFLAHIRSDLGDLSGARELQESVLSTLESRLPAGHATLLRTREALARTLGMQHDWAAAVRLQQSVVLDYERTLPEDASALVRSRGVLASMRKARGDLVGAKALWERVIESYERDRPAHDPDLLFARQHAANTLASLGDVAGARALMERVVADSARALPEDDRDLLHARWHLAQLRAAQGDVDGARALHESILRVRERALPEGHPHVLKARADLAYVLRLQGERDEALKLYERVLAGYDRVFPAGHSRRLWARMVVTLGRNRNGDEPGVRALIRAQVIGIRTRLERALTVSSREARFTLAGTAFYLDGLLYWNATRGDPSRAELFELMETRRHVATRAAGLRPVDGELGSRRAELARRDAVVNELVLDGPAGQDVAAWQTAIAIAALERGRAQRSWLEAMAEVEGFVARIEPASLAARLPEGSAAVGYHIFGRPSIAADTGEFDLADHLLAWVLVDGAVERIELGPLGPIEAAVEDWRVAVGEPVLRGVQPHDGDPAKTEREAGRALRERLLDPVLAVVGNATVLHVCLDDLLHLVPLDALALDEEVRVGDRYRIHFETSFARLMGPPADNAVEPRLVLVGDPDFDADVEDAAPSPSNEPPPLDLVERGSNWGPWSRLFGTIGEVHAIARLFHERHGEEAVVLSRHEATKAALRAALPGASHVHLATHGWFLPESVPSLDVVAPGGTVELSCESPMETVTGFAPLTLCGLCLAGANRRDDGRAWVPGLVTAQELSSFDLSACDLAVLSACETNVGVRRAGEGILSLQTALHAAGARTAVTSLWRVDDALTQRLMQAFYVNLWTAGMGKAEALWAAKRQLREEGYPVSAWSGWVLSGDPN